ncbi:FtsQ-type POTRA domain-containing protein [Lentibacillus cibarius]|uniref:Cell division protein DivIB n=1 Tax=Lentibacillus cibarius TaxID=2583219 RepID=A0A549YKA4_9BACI|nr:FtsQ-type POTRA domain-containing protein [Lentibacillus cibarius]TRM12312.1 FtsQ-type POTRA domain-containing protein [Lentibacillus cibarius]
MGKKNVVSIEDRIPTLKQERKKKANRRLIVYLSIFFFLICFIVYLQSPLSDVRTVDIEGNSFVPDEQVIEQSGIAKGTNIWTVNKEAVSKAVAEHPAISETDVKRRLPWTIELHITEADHVGYIKQNDSYYPILGNGKILTNRKQTELNGSAPLLIGFSKEPVLQNMTDELDNLSESIRNLISEIHWKPSDGDKHKILLYMNDGYAVDTTLRQFADKMSVYPSIVSQLESDNKGIIHIGVGAYFEEFGSNEEENGAMDEAVNEN